MQSQLGKNETRPQKEGDPRRNPHGSQKNWKLVWSSTPVISLGEVTARGSRVKANLKCISSSCHRIN